MAREEPIPVFLFTGFLDAGKTTFIQSNLEDKEFNDGKKKILVIRCEDGEEDYDVTAFSSPAVFLRTLDEEEQLTEDILSGWMKETKADRVMVEYNGMWSVQTLYDAMPDDWAVAQEICFAEAATFAVYNANMRSMVYDKLKTCDVIAFNRCSEDSDLDTLHKIVRQANRRCGIFYEYPDGRSIPDTKQDPLPFDLDASVVKIEDRDYAYFYADLMENMDKYPGKTVEFTATFPDEGKPLPPDFMVAGRMLMNCCAADTQLAGLPCYCGQVPRPARGSWFRVRGKIRLQRNKLFSGKLPVLDVLSIAPAAEPEEPVATFY